MNPQNPLSTRYTEHEGGPHASDRGPRYGYGDVVDVPEEDLQGAEVIATTSRPPWLYDVRTEDGGVGLRLRNAPERAMNPSTDPTETRAMIRTEMRAATWNRAW